MRKTKLKTKPSGIEKHPDGRDAGGKFVIGNKLGRGGTPLATKATALRAALLASLSIDDIHEIADVLIHKSKKGCVKSIRELLNRTIGKPGIASTAEPLQVFVEGEQIIASAMEHGRLVRIRHARGQSLDTPAPAVPVKDRVAVEADPIREIQRVKTIANKVLDDRSAE